MRKQLIVLVGVLLLLILLVPAVLVSLADDPGTSDVRNESEKGVPTGGPKVRVWLTREQRVEEVPLEVYIRGVVASEMPADFHPEALKAQALAARTYIVSRLMKDKLSDMEKYGKEGSSAHVTDTVTHQVYSTDQALRKAWGKKYAENLAKVDRAVRETAGQIITYEGKPIYAAFFSTSNGRTENSEDYFTSGHPYLRSVDSSWDRESPRYLKTISFPLKEMIQKLEQGTGTRIALQTTGGEPLVQVLQRTAGNRVSRVRIGDEVFSGRKVREVLGLPSSDFTMTVRGDTVQIVTRGYGHGVGMSQWGAHLMATRGETVDRIIRHYYRGVSIVPVETVWKADSEIAKVK
ncbi:stage II sporulation protein D [Staphylospora marina]|uniref:stage II sporulation protein D n=1 Tax=Staphylospora marina TaxID=2490858 RepID=UPI000F5BB90E|nr:stage II sporulation protein D [Staphylospora marina]